MEHIRSDDLADAVGADLGREALLEEITGKVDGLHATATDDDLDLWWGAVEIDRLASGLTLAAINKLSEPSSDDDPGGPWLKKLDVAGDEPTQLTPEGRNALRRIVAYRGS